MRIEHLFHLLDVRNGSMKNIPYQEGVPVGHGTMQAYSAVLEAIFCGYELLIVRERNVAPFGVTVANKWPAPVEDSQLTAVKLFRLALALDPWFREVFADVSDAGEQILLRVDYGSGITRGAAEHGGRLLRTIQRDAGFLTGVQRVSQEIKALAAMADLSPR